MGSSFDLSWVWSIGLISFAFGVVCGLGASLLLPGVEFSAGMEGIIERFDLSTDDRLLSYLPLAHIFERLFERSGKKMSDYIPIRPVRPHWRCFFEVTNSSMCVSMMLPSR